MLKKESKKTNCHSGLDPESSARAHNTKAYHASGCPIGSGMTGESGRSMIEMLGVLAVIGVLSVGGIAGYTSAMNKHRANELLNQISMRAVSVVAQIEFGNTPNVDDFGDYEGYSFTTDKSIYNKNQFTITIDPAPESVICKNMKNAVGPSTEIRNINTDCRIITYNNDMGTTAQASDYKDKTSCEAAGFNYCWQRGDGTVCVEGADCCAGLEMSSDCQGCYNGLVDDYRGISCIYTYPDGTTTNSTCASGGVCSDPEIIENQDCLTQDDCGGRGSGYYCLYEQLATASKDVYEALNCTGTTIDTCEYHGTCKAMNKRLSNTVIPWMSILGRPIYFPTFSSFKVNWLTARNVCSAIGKEMLRVEDLQCYKNGETLITENSETAGYCCAKGQTCSSWSTKLDSLKHLSEDNAAPYSPIAVLINNTIGTYFSRFWLSSDYGTSASSYYFTFGSAQVGNYSRKTGSYAVACW